MCKDTNNCSCGPAAPRDPFADLSEMEEDIWNRPTVSTDDVRTPEEEEIRRNFGHDINQAPIAQFEEKCKDCRGTGTFVSWAGRPVGPCFKCKGTGIRKFKTSPEARAKSREYEKRRKAKLLDAAVEKANAFRKANPDIDAWLTKNAGNPDFDFPDQMARALIKYGDWTPKQRAAVDKCVARDVERAAKRAAEPGSGLDLSNVISGMYAVPGGDTRLKVRIDNVASSKWAGWVFVKDGASYGAGKRYGSQKPGEQYRGDIVEELKAIAADPFEASKAYGKLVGRCGACGRKLEDEKSIEMGIGPICANKF